MPSLKRGDKVRIPKGTYIRGTFDGGEKLAARTHTVRIFALDEITSSGEPEVCWTGQGGYWHYAALADVEVL